MRRLATLAMTVALAASPSIVAGQESGGRLQTIRDAVRTSPANQEDDDDDDTDNCSQSCYDDDCCDDGPDLGISSVICELLFHIAVIPIWSPWSLATSDYSQPGDFLSHPYACDLPGYRLSVYDRPTASPDALTWPWASRARVEYADSYGGLSRIGVHGLFENERGAGVEASLDAWNENLARGGEDQFFLGNLNGLWRIVDGRSSTTRVGVGLNWLADDYGADFGVNFTTQVDWFVARPWIWSIALDAGSIGSTGLFRGRSTVGYMLGCAEFYAGYDIVHIGWEGEGDSLGGFVFGVQLWN